MTRSLIRCYDPGLYAWCTDFARRWPRYQQRDGTMNWSHILRAIEAEGFIEITHENVDAVKAALEARAARKATPPSPNESTARKAPEIIIHDREGNAIPPGPERARIMGAAMRQLKPHTSAENEIA